MQPLGLSSVIATIQRCLENLKLGDNLQRIEGLLWHALDQFPDIPELWFYAGCYLALTGRHALAIRCYERSYEIQPNPVIFTDIGASYRCLNRIEESRAALHRGLEAIPEDPQILTNLAGSYVNEGDPLPGIAYGERALARQVSEKTLWNLGLLYLEAGEYAKGFDFYAEGKHQHREQRVYEPDPPKLTPELHHEIKGTGKTLIVHGEQGIGDELMFGTMLMDITRDYEVIFDCHPRLEWLHRHSAWARELAREGREVRIHAGRKDFRDPKERPLPWNADAKCAIGDLCRLYRRSRDAFYWSGPTYQADEAETAEYRAFLEAFAGGRRIIGLATRGGELSTATRYRRLNSQALEQVLSRDCLFVGLDYEDMTEVQKWSAEKYGPQRYVWPAAINFHWDYHHVAALIAATDAVISVPQSVMHLSAGIGHPTEVLVPSRPDWRMGQTSSDWAWYPGEHCTLHRQKGTDWGPVIESAFAAIEARDPRRAAA